MDLLSGTGHAMAWRGRQRLLAQRPATRVLTTRVMGWPLGLASERPGLGRIVLEQRTWPDHAPGAGSGNVRAEAMVSIASLWMKVKRMAQGVRGIVAARILPRHEHTDLPIKLRLVNDR
jgi:hypothetical protein